MSTCLSVCHVVRHQSHDQFLYDFSVIKSSRLSVCCPRQVVDDVTILCFFLSPSSSSYLTHPFGPHQ
jgi:hypothetical protein